MTPATTPPRFDLYTLVHKGQRLKLFDVAVRAGRLGAADSAAREALVTDVRLFLGALAVHGESEDRFVGPLLGACAPEMAARIHAAHQKIEGLSTTLRQEADRAVAEPSPAADAGLYRAVCRLAMFYLEHIDAEEHVGQPALWAAYDDARLATAQADIVAAHDPATVAYNLRCMLPAATPAERIGFLAGMKRRLPPPAFAGMRASIGALVDASEWQAIDAAAAA